MQDTFKFRTHRTTTVQNEKIKGFVMHVGAYATDDVDGNPVIANIANLNEIQIDLLVKRKVNGQYKEIVIFNGYLLDLLIGMYAQTVSYQLQLVKREGYGYLITIGFGGATLDIQGEDEFIIRTRFQSTAFTSLVLANSNITIETVPSTSPATDLIPCYQYKNVGNGEANFDHHLSGAVDKIVVAVDPSNPYLTSNKSKVTTFDIKEGRGVFSKNVTDAILVAENINMFDNNPESDVMDLVVFAESTPINGANLKMTLQPPADDFTKVIWRSIKPAY